jgi:hypothetical protein
VVIGVVVIKLVLLGSDDEDMFMLFILMTRVVVVPPPPLVGGRPFVLLLAPFTPLISEKVRVNCLFQQNSLFLFE